MLTQEQTKIIDTVLSKEDNRIVAINAVAGSGKTFTINEVIKAYQPKNGFYSAFNKAIVEDSKKRFGKLLPCKTFHALAYQYIKPDKKIEDMNYSTITEKISYDDKNTVITLIDDFFRSKSTDIYDFVEINCYNLQLQELTCKYAEMMLEGKINPTFNYLLKLLHLLLHNKELEIDFDFLAFDEVQDVIPVTLEIFKLINANRKVIFGDTYQNIYSFMNTVNAFEELKNLNLLKLTKSFRCNQHIADYVELYGRRYLDEDFLFKGNEFIKPLNNTAFISRTNATLIERMHNLLENNQSFSLTRKINEIFALPLALLNASRGKEVFDKKYKFLEKEYQNFSKTKTGFSDSYFQYIIQITEDSSLENAIKVLTNFRNKRIDIYKVKEKVTNLKPDKKIILTTAHAFKGLEADTVYIEEDLNNSINRINFKLKGFDGNEYLSKEDREDLNTYYVALSRAKSKLINNKY